MVLTCVVKQMIFLIFRTAQKKKNINTGAALVANTLNLLKVCRITWHKNTGGQKKHISAINAAQCVEVKML